MQKSFITNNKKETWDLIPEILDNLKGRNLVLLKGELGSGKTTLAQGILKFLGARGPFTSPTFVIMKKYVAGKIQDARCNNQANLKFKNRKSKILNLKSIFHLDCYRIGAKDMLELGWKEIIKDKNRKTEIVLYPGDYGFGTWKKP